MGPTHGLGTKGPVRVAVIIPLCPLKPKPAEELSRGWGEVGGNRRAFCPHPPSTDLGPSTPCRRRGSYSKGPSVPQPLLASLPRPMEPPPGQAGELDTQGGAASEPAQSGRLGASSGFHPPSATSGTGRLTPGYPSCLPLS